MFSRQNDRRPLTRRDLSEAEIAPCRSLARRRGAKLTMPCPICGPLHGADKALQHTFAMWPDNDFPGYNCLRCNTHGRILSNSHFKSGADRPQARDVVSLRLDEEADRRRRVDVARRMWCAASSAIDTPAETYLRSVRGCDLALPATIRCLNRYRDSEFPMLLAACGPALETEDGDLEIADEDVKAVIAIALRHDGRAKAPVDVPKRSYGLLKGNPCRLWPVNDGLALGIFEGIEDALSFAKLRRGGAWAVGGAGFLAAAAAEVPSYIECLTLGEDDNAAGRLGCDGAHNVIAGRRDWHDGRAPSVKRLRMPSLVGEAQ